MRPVDEKKEFENLSDAAFLDKEFGDMGKKVYDDIEIPAELNDVVNRAIASRKKEDVQRMAGVTAQGEKAVAKFGENGSGSTGAEIRRFESGRKRVGARIFRYGATAAAALLVCLTVGLNTSESFAKEMQELPVIGGLAKVLTIRSYHGTEGDYEMNIEVPEIAVETAGEAAEDAASGEIAAADDAASGENMAADGAASGETIAATMSGTNGLDALQNDAFTADINAEIQRIVDDYIAQAKADMEDYKEAFFETGGTEEEWNDRTMDIYVDYDVKYQQGNILSLELITAKAWVASEEERHYYNLDLEKGENLTLEQLLGEDYIRIATESIDAQIKERIKDESQIFFGYGADDGMIEGFTELSPDAKFYINGEGNVVIVFDEYEIAPGYMGFPEFEIP